MAVTAGALGCAVLDGLAATVARVLGVASLSLFVIPRFRSRKTRSD